MSYPLFGAYSGPSSRLESYSATRRKELQLIHQWSTITCLNSGPRNIEAFRDYTVNKALKYSYFIDILLAFTSTYSTSKAAGAVEAYEHVTTALHYQNQNIAELNRNQLLVSITTGVCP